jgi:chromosomal replication initiation ATPase DnaA
MSALKQGSSNGAHRQLILDLPRPAPRYDPVRYVVADANREARRLVDLFADSDALGLAISGPAAAGKTHLLHLAAALNGADILAAADLERARGRSRGPVAIDDCETWRANVAFEFVEEARGAGRKLLLAGCGRPATWAGGLKDLETRLEGMVRIELAEPDENLLAAVIRQHFATRQLVIRGEVAAFAAPRMPRTFAAADAFATETAAEAARSGRPITVPLAKKVLENLFEGAPSP